MHLRGESKADWDDEVSRSSQRLGHLNLNSQLRMRFSGLGSECKSIMTNSDHITSIYITRVKLIYPAINFDAQLGERNPPIAMSKPKPRGYWTKERCHEEAKRFNSRKAFQKGSTAYTRAHKAGWLDDICQHMSGGRVPNGYWTKQRCHDEAKKFLTRVEFENSSAFYLSGLS